MDGSVLFPVTSTVTCPPGQALAGLGVAVPAIALQQLVTSKGTDTSSPQPPKAQSINAIGKPTVGLPQLKLGS